MYLFCGAQEKVEVFRFVSAIALPESNGPLKISPAVWSHVTVSHNETLSKINTKWNAQQIHSQRRKKAILTHMALCEKVLAPLMNINEPIVFGRLIFNFTDHM